MDKLKSFLSKYLLGSELEDINNLGLGEIVISFMDLYEPLKTEVVNEH